METGAYLLAVSCDCLRWCRIGHITLDVPLRALRDWAERALKPVGGQLQTPFECREDVSAQTVRSVKEGGHLCRKMPFTVKVEDHSIGEDDALTADIVLGKGTRCVQATRAGRIRLWPNEQRMVAISGEIKSSCSRGEAASVRSSLCV